jgi:CBS domain-containing protein
MHVRDVMTDDVVTVGPDASYAEIVDRLLAHDISGVPVTDDDGVLLGIVTEADLVTREAYGPERRRPLGLILDYLRDHDPTWVRKASASTARRLMTHEVTTASPDDELRVTAQRLLESGFRRLPVVGTDGRLVGIVSRRDVLAAVYGRPPDSGPSSRR